MSIRAWPTSLLWLVGGSGEHCRRPSDEGASQSPFLRLRRPESSEVGFEAEKSYPELSPLSSTLKSRLGQLDGATLVLRLSLRPIVHIGFGSSQSYSENENRARPGSFALRRGCRFGGPCGSTTSKCRKECLGRRGSDAEPHEQRQGRGLRSICYHLPREHRLRQGHRRS
jgi:hypothetical protein